MPCGPAARASTAVIRRRVAGCQWSAWLIHSKARACRPSPARIAVASSKARWQVGWPRRRSSSSIAGRTPRIGTNLHHRGGGHIHCRFGGDEDLAAGIGQYRTYALAAAGHAVAHGIIEAVQLRQAVMQLLVQVGVDTAPAGSEILLEPV